MYSPLTGLGQADTGGHFQGLEEAFSTLNGRPGHISARDLSYPKLLLP